MTALSHTVTVHIANLDALARFAAWLAPQLRAGDIVSLDGPLGAGKTTFTQKLGEALGLQESVASPTFVLMHEYLSGRLPVVHVDLYRLGPEKAASFSEELYAIMDEGRSLLLIEWACYGDFLADSVTVAIQLAPHPENTDARRLFLQADRPLRDGIAEFQP